MPIKRSAMILAGGEARRVNGREKYLFSYRGCSFISRLVMTFEGLVDEIVIVAKNERQTEHFTGLPSIVRCTWDKKSGLGPIGGISAGLDEIQGDMVFISACDMPTVHKLIVQYMFENIGEYDAIIPEWEKTDLEPLHAVYRVSALREYIAKHESLSLRDMINTLNTKRIPPEMFRTIDPQLESFRNVNTLEELLAMGPEAAYQEKHPEK